MKLADSNKRKNAFSLAEILVAVAVLGILAVIILPVVLSSKPNENKLKFKKAYYSLENAVQSLINDSSNYPAEEYIFLASGDKYYKGFNYTAPTTNGIINKFCYLLSQSMNVAGDVNCPGAGDGYDEGRNLVNFTTADGIVWGLYYTISDNDTSIEDETTASNPTLVQFPLDVNAYETRVLIDVNGDKGPNCTQDINGTDVFTPFEVGGTTTFNYQANCKDPDRFVIGVRYDGKLRVGMSNVSTDVVTDSYALEVFQNISKMD